MANTRPMTALAMVACLLLAGGQALAQPRLPTFRSGDVIGAGDLNRIVDQVRRNTSALGGVGGARHTVDCDAGETIANAMSRAHSGSTIVISGTCEEAVVVDKDGITLDGGGTAVIDGAGMDRWAVDVTGRQKVTIKGLTVQNGHASGIAITETSGVWMQDVSVRNTRRHTDYNGDGHGIFVGHASSLVLTGTIVADDNAGNGITVWQSGNALAIGNFKPRGRPFPRASIQTNGNGESGIFVTGSSTFTAFSNFGDNTTVHAKENTYAGISLQHTSSMMLGGADIEATNNGGSGLEVGGGSSAQFWGWAAESKAPSALFDSNGGAGISIWGSSSFNVWDDGVAVNITSTNNGWRGLDIWGGSDAGFNTPASEPTSKLVFNGNGAEGIEVGGNGTLYSRLPFEIKNNAYEGVGIWAGGHVSLEGSTIADNTGNGIAAATNTALWLTTSRIENNGNDGIEVSNNSTAHFNDITVTGNGGNGFSVYNHAFIQAYNDPGSSITGNGGHGIVGWNGVSIQLQNATITGNTNNDVNASFGSRFHLYGDGTIDDIYCDDSVLDAGDFLCPE